MYKSQISKYFDDHFDEILASLKEIMSIDSTFQTPKENMPFGEGSAKALKWGADFGQSLGMKVKNFDNYAVSMDFKDGDPKLGILSHLDVVPASEGWHYPPFDCTVDGDNIYGRGAIDDKGPSVAVLYAVKCIKDLGIPIKENFRIIFGGNEEGGCQDIEYYEKQEKFPPMVFTPDGTFPILNCEKGMVHMNFSGKLNLCGKDDFEVKAVKGGTVINAIPDKAKCICRGISADELAKAFEKINTDGDIEIEDDEEISFIITGKSAHGSRPERGENAVTALLKLLTYLGCKDAERLARLFPHGECNGKSAGLGFSDKVSGEMTCALTTLDFDGENLNGGIDVRFPIDKTLKEISDIITASLEKIDMHVTDIDGMEPHYVSEDSPLVKALLEVYRDVKGEEGECIAEGGITYVHNTEGGVAFGAEFPDEQNNMHGADEHISIKTFKYNLNMYANAIVKICG